MLSRFRRLLRSGRQLGPPYAVVSARRSSLLAPFRLLQDADDLLLICSWLIWPCFMLCLPMLARSEEHYHIARPKLWRYPSNP